MTQRCVLGLYLLLSTAGCAASQLPPSAVTRERSTHVPGAPSAVCGKPGRQHCGPPPELPVGEAAEELQLPPNTWACSEQYEVPTASLPDQHCTVRDCTLYVGRQVSVPYSTNWGGPCRDASTGQPGTCVDGLCATPADKAAACGAYAVQAAASEWVNSLRTRQGYCTATRSPAECSMERLEPSARSSLVTRIASCMEDRTQFRHPEPLLPWGSWPIELSKKASEP